MKFIILNFKNNIFIFFNIFSNCNISIMIKCILNIYVIIIIFIGISYFDIEINK